MRVAGPGSRAPARGRPRKLTIEAIAAGALAVMRRDGLEGLTIAATAAELGVGVATMYGYVSTKDDLMSVAADDVLGRLEAFDATQPWAQEAKRIYRTLYQLLVDEPGVAQILSTRAIMGAGTAHAMEVMLEALEAGGLTGRQQVAAYRTLLAFVLGSSLLYTSHSADPETENARRAQQQALDPDTYPAIHNAWRHLIAPTRPQQFEDGLSDLLDRFIDSGDH